MILQSSFVIFVKPKTYEDLPEFFKIKFQIDKFLSTLTQVIISRIDKH